MRYKRNALNKTRKQTTTLKRDVLIFFLSFPVNQSLPLPSHKEICNQKYQGVAKRTNNIKLL